MKQRRLKIQATTVSLLLVIFLQSYPFMKVVAEGTSLQLGEPVTGTISDQNPEDWYGVSLGRGEYNITLSVEGTADLAFNVSQWWQGFIMASLFGEGPIFTVDEAGVGGTESKSFVVPLVAEDVLLVPGDYLIGVYLPTGGSSGSYNLTVSQTKAFSAITVGEVASFTDLTAGSILLYTINISIHGVFNFTMLTNDTSSSFQTGFFEDEIGFPSTFGGFSGSTAWLLAGFSPSTLYVEMNLTGSSGTVKGNFTVSEAAVTIITPGTTLNGTLSSGAITFFKPTLTFGNYYNVTLEVPDGVDMSLDLYSPSYPSPAFAFSNNMTAGADEKISDLVLYQFSSYAVSASNGYQASVPAMGLMGVRPDRVLIGISGDPEAFNLGLSVSQFPALAPNVSVDVQLNSTVGPYYRFYTTTESTQTVYNISFLYDGSGSIGSNSSIGLTVPLTLLKSFSAAPGYFQTLFMSRILFGLEGYKAVADSWIGEAAGMSDTDFNTVFPVDDKVLSTIAATLYSGPVYVGVRLSDIMGDTAYNGTLSYVTEPPLQLNVDAEYSDFIEGLNLNLYKINLLAGHNYKFSAKYVTADILWTVFDDSGLLSPSFSPIFWLFLVNDLDYPNAGDYFMLSPTESGTFYILASPMTLALGDAPQRPPSEGAYTFFVEEIKAPTLSVSLSIPVTQNVGEPFTTNATLTNKGSSVINAVQADLTLPIGLLTSDALTVNIGTLTPGQTVVLAWNLTSSAFGVFSVDVGVTSENAPEVHSHSEITILGPNLQITIESPISAQQGTTFNATATIANNGQAISKSVIATITLPSGLSTTTPVAISLGDLEAGEKKNATWSVTASESGEYTIEVISVGSFSSDEASTRLLVMPLPTLTVLVRDSGTGDPTEGANVTINGNSQLTNATGYAIFTNLASGTYTLTVAKDGYNTISQSISVATDRTESILLTSKLAEIPWPLIGAIVTAVVVVAVVTAYVLSRRRKSQAGKNSATPPATWIEENRLGNKAVCFWGSRKILKILQALVTNLS